MSDQISWTLTAQFTGGPKVCTSQAVPVGAYDKVEVKVAGGTSAVPGTATAKVQPESSEENLEFLLITSDRYGDGLTYTVENTAGTAGAQDVRLDAPQLFVGQGAIGLLIEPPNQIEFSNELGDGKDANISILVGRKVG